MLTIWMLSVGVDYLDVVCGCSTSKCCVWALDIRMLCVGVEYLDVECGC